MTPDIFISYSRKDASQALELVEQLRSSGFGVWIDQQAIDASTSWSKEIVKAIDDCKVFLVLLSESSVTSANVVREISLALESRKSILPIDITQVALTNEVRYQLAGIQRVSLSEYDRILAGLVRLGLTLVNDPEQPVARSASIKDGRKSLLVMPFEDLSPGQDNLWFADGLAGELIDSLNQIKALRLIDRKTSSTLRNSPHGLYEIAKTLDVRYVIEGSVRKFGEQLKISVSLLDVKEGEHLWQYSHKGVMEDIFEIQEQVATKVVEGLKLHLSEVEASGISERGTNNVEAYTLLMRAYEYSRMQTHSSLVMAKDLSRAAIAQDDSYTAAYALLGAMLIREYKMYTPTPEILEEAESIVQELRRRDPGSRFALNTYSSLLYAKGETVKAIEVAEEQIRAYPQFSYSYITLAQAYTLAGRYADADAAYEAGVKIEPSMLSLYWNAVSVSSRAHDDERKKKWAEQGIPFYERFLKLHPDDEAHQIQYISLLESSGREREAAEAMSKLPIPSDPVSGYNLACLAAILGEHLKAIEILKISLSGEHNLLETVKEDPDFDVLRQYPEFITLIGGS